MTVNSAQTDYENHVFTGNEKEKNVEIAKCPNCGANMLFDPEKQVLRCDFCGTEKAFEINRNEEQDFEKLFERNNTWSEETHVFSCSNCGAKVVISKREISKICPFCGTSNVVETEELSGMKPNAIVPFKISKETAAEKALNWARKKFFAPRRFKKYLTHADDITGTYNPAFTFDTDTVSTYYGRLARTETYTTRVNGKTVTRTRTVYFNISGVYSTFFDDILVQASSRIDQKTIDKLQPFDTNNSKEYAEEFLHGYGASQYTRDGKECWGAARKIIDGRIRSGILAKYSYSYVDYLNVNTECNDIKFKYLLLPIYVGKFNWRRKADKKAKIYNFFVSGFNGKVVGQSPVSPLKVGLLTLGIAALVALAIWFGIKFL